MTSMLRFGSSLFAAAHIVMFVLGVVTFGSAAKADETLVSEYCGPGVNQTCTYSCNDTSETCSFPAGCYCVIYTG